ncbi:MAG: M28 family peptidase [Elusimicrobiota bacterium]|jgi:hypothetical protein
MIRSLLEGLRAKTAVVAFNLGLFILITLLPAFETAHHHWIFPILASLLAVQWALALALPEDARLLEPRATRAAIVSCLAFLLIMGILRHATILACFDRCAFKLAAAAALAAAVFFAHRRQNDPGFWSPERSTLAAIGALSWAGYLALRGARIAPWAIDTVFAVLALLLFLGRDRAAFLIASVAVAAALAIQATANEYAIIGLGVLFGVAVPLAAIPKVDAWLKRRAERKAQREAQDAQAPRPLRIRVLMSAARIIAAVGVLTALGVYLAGPIEFMTHPAKRKARLNAMAPAFPIRDPRRLSPLAARLRGHVVFLAQTLGERDVAQPEQQRARKYISAQLRAFGYSPETLPYESQWLPSVKNGTQFSNVEAVLSHAPADAAAAWVIGAHYDTTAGTPGADDNASGVAVLLETARLLKERRPDREVRFVAFGTEEPPSFGTRNMGSYRYAHALKENGVAIHGMISLEMLGYFNPKRGSQLYPPFLHLFYPDHGDYAAAIGDFRSRGLVGEFKAAWRSCSSFPLTATVLPGPLSGLALSDQLNFWSEGFPALMLSDTAFYRNPNYHEAGDKPDTLDYEKMAQVTRALAGTIAAENIPAD